MSKISEMLTPHYTNQAYSMAFVCELASQLAKLGKDQLRIDVAWCQILPSGDKNHISKCQNFGVHSSLR